MPRLSIDHHTIEVPAGTTILEAARQLGIGIPTLCHWPGVAAQTSCFVCVVRVNGAERLVPACATAAVEGMVVESETPAIHAARRTALELLLSDHLGDCLAPCQLACPSGMDIPAMLRQIAAGQYREALRTCKAHIALPAVLGRICPELCERACRRGQSDAPVAICRLKLFVADVDLASGDPYLPPCAPPSGKRVAIIGAGPAGLAAAYDLQQRGHACTVYDRHAVAGGALRTVDPGQLPPEVLAAEIALIARLGVQFRLNKVIEEPPALLRDYDTVLLATGANSIPDLSVSRETMMTAVPGVFAAGSVVAMQKYAVRALADGAHAALAIEQYLAGQTITLPGRPFSVHMGRLDAEETAAFSAAASPAGRVELVDEAAARQESARCLHCDCRKLHTCRLREQAVACGAHAGAFHGHRRTYTADATHPDLIYEPGKCIACGLCVRIAAEAGEALGLAFIGRGFTVRLAVPFGGEVSAGLAKVARQCAEACPTAALALKDIVTEPMPEMENQHACR